VGVDLLHQRSRRCRARRPRRPVRAGRCSGT
jgi:hypothetical protein